MSNKEQILQQIVQQRLLPLYYHDSAAVSLEILQSLYEAGIRVIEYTNRGVHALDNFKELKKAKEEIMPDMLLGIGTIKTADQAKQYIAAGADFIVCPTINEQVAEVTHEAGLLWIPGCMTPTEIAAAEMAGATLVKIFPGNILGPGYISAIKELFPEIKFMPTGGVEAEEKNLKAWFKSGVVAVGMGSKLITKEMVQQKNYAALKETTTTALQLIQRVTQTAEQYSM
jgi:2-dehydro-3-deoxyphosphogluconate aldolase/(4S)-4-hydroxy-2-oxoglutarate aldolase